MTEEDFEQTPEQEAAWAAWVQRQEEAAASVAGYGPPDPPAGATTRSDVGVLDAEYDLIPF